jgi:hypothetical protein
MAPAGATTCGVGSSCTFDGTVTLASGTITLTAPDSLAWSAPLTGLDQHVVDANPPDQRLEVVNALGVNATWNITAAATQFTSGTNTLPVSGTLSMNGSLSDFTSPNAPTPTCFTGSTCSLPTNAVSYPLPIATDGTAVTVFDNTNDTVGRGHIVIGNFDGGLPIGWWVNIPGSAAAGAYTSHFTMAITTGP